MACFYFCWCHIKPEKLDAWCRQKKLPSVCFPALTQLQWCSSLIVYQHDFFFPMLWFSYNHTESSSICIHSPFRIAFIPARLNWWCTPRVKASEMRNPCNQTVTNSPFLSQGCVTIGHFCHYSWDSGCTQGLAPAFQSTISQSMCISTLQGMNDGMFEKKVLAVCWVWHQPLLLDLSSCQTNCWLTTWWMVIVATYLQVQITFNWMKGWWIKSTHTAVCEGVLYVGNRKC